mmetsp:Transcript_36254/g.85019  ORF Transcript_36254/g.85019 Transcript_36254/m.85019 type:complete len:203 (-) Transcript_36254:803-1411(-)
MCVLADPLYTSTHSASLSPSPNGACCRTKVLGRSWREMHCHVMRSVERVLSAQASSVGAGGTRFSRKCMEETASRRGAMLSVSCGPVKLRLGVAVEAATAPFICFSSLCVATSRYTAASSSAAIWSARSSMPPHTVSFCLCPSTRPMSSAPFSFSCASISSISLRCSSLVSSCSSPHSCATLCLISAHCERIDSMAASALLV